jgi:hypothetical protein
MVFNNKMTSPSTPTSAKHAELLSQAERLAAPKTKLLAARTGLAAVLVLGITLANVFLPSPRVLLDWLYSAWHAAADAIGWVLGLVMHALGSILGSVWDASLYLLARTCTPLGLTTLAGAVVLMLLWHRSRVYVMQGLARLIWDVELEQGEGRELFTAVKRTHQRVQRGIAAVMLFSWLTALRGAFVPTCSTEVVMTALMLGVGCAVLLVRISALSDVGITAYALTLGCLRTPLGTRELLEAGETSSIIHQRVSGLFYLGLGKDTKAMRRMVVKEAQYLLSKQLSASEATPPAAA